MIYFIEGLGEVEVEEGGNQLDQIFFLHQPIHMIVEWNKKRLHKVNKKLGEMTKVCKGFINPKKGGHIHFFKKAPKNH